MKATYSSNGRGSTSDEITADQFRNRFVDQEESGLQIRSVKWFRMAFPQFWLLLYKIPNDGDRSEGEAGRVDAEGLIKGMPDLCLAIPRHGYGALYIEMKTINGVASEHQKRCHEILTKAGNAVAMPQTFEEFQYLIYKYLWKP